MKVICFIDSLNGGGAQRQLTNVAIGLKHRGFEILFVVIYPLYQFRPRLEDAGIEIVCLGGRNPLIRMGLLARLVYSYQPDALLSFLRQPNFLSSIIKLLFFWRRMQVVVSERNNPAASRSFAESLRLRIYSLANAVLFNSESVARAFVARSPSIGPIAHVIYNIVDESFLPLPAVNNAVPVIVVAAHYRPEKNIQAVIKVAAILASEGRRFLIRLCGMNFFVDGQPTEQSAVYLEAVAEVRRLGLDECVELRGFESDPKIIYADADALLLPSLHEGFPNTICEAMTCGKVILCSAVSDLPLWIKFPVNGFLFEPTDLQGLKESIEWLLGLSDEQKRRIGRNNSRLASKLFARDQILNCYAALLGDGQLKETLINPNVAIGVHRK